VGGLQLLEGAPPEAAPDHAVWVGPASPVDTPPPARNLAPIPHAIHPPLGADRVPVGITPDDAPAQLEWLSHEVDRFNHFVAQQLANMQRGREEVARAAARTEAAFVAREQEFNRRQAAALARADALARQREEELARQRAEVERRVAEVERMEAAVRRRLAEAEQIEEELRADLEAQERELERRRRALEEAARAAPPAADPHADDALESLGLSRWQ
jgi:hypothetical protein